MPSQPPSVYFSSSLFVCFLLCIQKVKASSLGAFRTNQFWVEEVLKTRKEEEKQRMKKMLMVLEFVDLWNSRMCQHNINDERLTIHKWKTNIKNKTKLIIIDSTCIIYHSWVQLQKKTEQVWLVCFLKKTWKLKKKDFWNNLDRRTEETEVEALAVQRLMKSKPSINTSQHHTVVDRWWVGLLLQT